MYDSGRNEYLIRGLSYPNQYTVTDIHNSPPNVQIRHACLCLDINNSRDSGRVTTNRV